MEFVIWSLAVSAIIAGTAILFDYTKQIQYRKQGVKLAVYSTIAAIFIQFLIVFSATTSKTSFIADSYGSIQFSEPTIVNVTTIHYPSFSLMKDYEIVTHEAVK